MQFKMTKWNVLFCPKSKTIQITITKRKAVYFLLKNEFNWKILFNCLFIFAQVSVLVSLGIDIWNWFICETKNKYNLICLAIRASSHCHHDIIFMQSASATISTLKWKSTSWLMLCMLILNVVPRHSITQNSSFRPPFKFSSWFIGGSWVRLCEKELCELWKQ